MPAISSEPALYVAPHLLSFDPLPYKLLDTTDDISSLKHLPVTEIQSLS